MKLTLLLLLCFSLTSLSCTSQPQVSRIEIVQPSIQQEATSIWRTINDYSFFEQQGYTINLPKAPVIDSLIVKSRNGTFGNDDFPVIYALLEDGLFNPEDYTKATQSVADRMKLLNDLVGTINAEKDAWDWKFNMFDTYKIVFTLYGSGGSYDPDQGLVTLLTNNEGWFMKYENPAYSIIHEITHMGMEYSIVRKYKLSHGTKERMVDTFVFLMFNEQLPEYRIQDMGDKNIDQQLSTQQDLQRLDAIASTFKNK